MGSYSPMGSTPGHESYIYNTSAYYEADPYASPSPTPSPRHYYSATAAGQPRPATRAHFRTPSHGYAEFSSPRQATPSPRFTSSGQYATVNVSSSRSRKHSSSHAKPEKRERRHSHSYYRPSDHYGDTDEDEYFEIEGFTYVLPARSRRQRRYSTNRGQQQEQEQEQHYAGYETNHHYYFTQGGYSTPARERDPAGYASPRFEPQPQAEPVRRARRSSTSVPQRPQTARPSSSHHNKKPTSTKKASQPPPAAQAPRKATEEDARKARIPSGYSLKNWDPTEKPILLLGSVFDANSLGKWIYDWTVFHHGAEAPLSGVSGELWLLLIQLSGKIKRSEEIMGKIRLKDNREMVNDFIESGDRLMTKLRKLLRTCESYMLTSKKASGQLGTNAGVEFVEAMFGTTREMPTTESFMQAVRLWNLRFDANCEEVLMHPGA